MDERTADGAYLANPCMPAGVGLARREGQRIAVARACLLRFAAEAARVTHADLGVGGARAALHPVAAYLDGVPDPLRIK